MAVKLCGDECEVVLADEMERLFQADGNSVTGNEAEEASLAMKSLLGRNKELNFIQLVTDRYQKFLSRGMMQINDCVPRVSWKMGLERWDSGVRKMKGFDGSPGQNDDLD